MSRRPSFRSPARAAISALALVSLALTGCAPTVSMEPADLANDAACAAVSVLLPDVLAGEDRRWTDAQATAAWGSPTAILLTCGLEPPGPTTLPCSDVGGVDWIIDDSAAPNYTFTTFGRTPAVQVYLDYDRVSSGETLQGLTRAVSTLPVDGACSARPEGD